jgi:hypothetical protein
MGSIITWTHYHADLTLEEGKRIMREQDGIIRCIANGHECRGNITPGHHWTAKWVATRGEGNRGMLVLLPRSSDARAIARNTTIEEWEHDLRMTHRQAARLYDAPFSYKRELKYQVADMVANPHCHQACHAFPGIGPRLRRVWEKKWGLVVSPYTEGLSMPRVEALCGIVSYITR